MRGPSGTGVRAFVGDHELAERVGRMCKKVMGRAMKTMIGRNRGVGFKREKAVKGKESLREKVTPQVHGERRVDSGEGCKEMIFKRPNSSFGKIRAMVAGRLQLEGYVVFAKEGKEVL